MIFLERSELICFMVVEGGTMDQDERWKMKNEDGCLFGFGGWLLPDFIFFLFYVGIKETSSLLWIEEEILVTSLLHCFILIIKNMYALFL